ncbi:hypothetical protein [Falsiroseomonas sp. CW058]|uniref:hypothetical protein n=1 Tax=Falsiroseomonas sp. CW058 TaxID=3388664 RepID=UPI003D320207
MRDPGTLAELAVFFAAGVILLVLLRAVLAARRGGRRKGRPDSPAPSARAGAQRDPAAGRPPPGPARVAASLRDELRRTAAERDAALARVARLEARVAELEGELRAAQSPTGAEPRFREVKAAFARLYHPDRLGGSGPARRLREEVFKEFWSEIERIERG